MAGKDLFSGTCLSLNGFLKEIENYNLHLSSEELRNFSSMLVCLEKEYNLQNQKSGNQNPSTDPNISGRNFSNLHGKKYFTVLKLDYRGWYQEQESKAINKLVVDFCKVSEIVLDTEGIVPKAKSIWPNFRNKKYFSTLKLNYGCYQSFLSEKSKAPAAGFVYEGQPFRFNKVIPGMYVSEYGFQKVMESMLKDMVPEKVVVYLDTAYIFGETEDELYRNAMKTIKQLSEKCKMPLDLAECTIFEKSVELLGYRVSNNKLKIPDKKLEAIKNTASPKTLIELFEFMVLARFYKDMIKGFARLAAPLTDLLNVKLSVVKNLDWQKQHQVSFEVLKKKFLMKPRLAIFDEKAAKILYVTASKIAIEGDLYQIDSKTKEKHAIGYFSAKVKSDSKNWDLFDLEMLAITESCQYFEAYLKKCSFTVYTRITLEIYKNRFKAPSSRLKKLKSKIGGFSFKVRHVSKAEATDHDFYEFVTSA